MLPQPTRRSQPTSSRAQPPPHSSRNPEGQGLRSCHKPAPQNSFQPHGQHCGRPIHDSSTVMRGYSRIEPFSSSHRGTIIPTEVITFATYRKDLLTGAPPTGVESCPFCCHFRSESAFAVTLALFCYSEGNRRLQCLNLPENSYNPPLHKCRCCGEHQKPEHLPATTPKQEHHRRHNQ